MSDNLIKCKHLGFISWFRGIAILFVVITHMNVDVVMSYSWGAYWRNYVGDGTYLFIFISGYLFWHLIDGYSWRLYFLKKITGVLLPYIFVMTVTLLFVYLLSIFDIYSDQYSSLLFVVRFDHPFEENGLFWHYLVGGAINFPLWFIPLVCIFYLLSLPIKLLCENKYFNYFFVFFLVVTLTTRRTDFILFQFIHFLGVYLFGVFCKLNELYIFNKRKVILYISMPLSFFFLYFSVLYSDYSYVSDSSFFVLFNFRVLQKVLFIISVVSFFVFLENRQWDGCFLDLLAKYSFGVYFIHFYYLVVVSYLFNFFGFEYSILKYFLGFCMVVFLSLATCYIIKLIFPKSSRYLLGI